MSGEQTKEKLMDLLLGAASFGFMKAKNEIDKKEEAKETQKAENGDVDKRKLIDEVAGMMKSAGCDDEIIRTAIAKMEKIGYDDSEAKTANNQKAKNKCQNENDDEKKEEKVEEFEKDVEKTAENKKAKNSSDDVASAFYRGGETVSSYVSQAERIELGMKY